jgi:hypothetical protein
VSQHSGAASRSDRPTCASATLLQWQRFVRVRRLRDYGEPLALGRRGLCLNTVAPRLNTVASHLNTVAPRFDRIALPARLQRYSNGSASSEFGDYATMGSRSRSAGEGPMSQHSGAALRPARTTRAAALRPATATGWGLTMYRADARGSRFFDTSNVFPHITALLSHSDPIYIPTYLSILSISAHLAKYYSHAPYCQVLPQLFRIVRLCSTVATCYCFNCTLAVVSPHSPSTIATHFIARYYHSCPTV